MRTTIHFQNLYHRPLSGVPFTYGVPVPAGAARSAADLALLGAAGEPVPLAVQALATWPDGSVRWALLDFQGTFGPNETADWVLVIGERSPPVPPAGPVLVQDGPEGVRVGNGRLEALFGRERFRLVDHLTADGVALVTPAGRSDLVAVAPAGKIYRASYDPAPRLSVEDATPLRAVVRWDGGLFAGDGTRLTEYRLKLTFYADNPYIKIEHAAVCREPPELGVELREYHLELETAQDRATTKVVRQRIHGVDNVSRLVELRQNVHLLVPTKTGESQPLEQVGILGAVGKPVLEDEQAFQEDVASFPHYLRPGAPRLAVGGGYAMVFPFVGVRDGQRTVVASFLRMAPQHPKGIAVDENRIRFEIWPAGNGLWRLARGMTKTHHLAVSFFGRSLSPDQIDGEAIRREYFAYPQLSDPVQITLEPEYVRQTRQAEAHKLLPRLPQRYPKLETKIEGIQLHGQPLAYAGMMDYGEAIATNNEEDQGHEYAMEYYRRGAYDQYLKLVAQMLHNSTVDVVDWDPDPLRMGGTPYHTDDHQDAVCVTSHTWTEGMFEYAYITGDREAYRAAVGICEWILRYMNGKPQLVRQDGREIGWPLIALVAGYRATADQRYLDAANELAGYYRDRVDQYGDLLNREPPGTDYLLIGYGEYTAYEGLHKLWELTRDESLRQFALECIQRGVDRGHISFHGHGRMMDLYPIYAAYDLSQDAKWLELAKRFLPVVLARPDWDGYLYRRIIHFLGLCHEHGLIDDNLVVLAK